MRQVGWQAGVHHVARFSLKKLTHLPPPTPTDEDGAFGIRIENVLVVRKSAPPCSFGGDVWLEFEPITKVPISTRCVDLTMLSTTECAWLNAYNAEVRDTLLPLLSACADDADAAAWLLRETRAVEAP